MASKQSKSKSSDDQVAKNVGTEKPESLEPLRIWKRTSLYMMQDIRLMLCVKTYVNARGDKPIGNEMLMCHCVVDSANVDWALYDRVIFLNGADGVMPLADSTIGLVIERGNVIDAELGRVRNEYFFRMGSKGNDNKKIRMATGRLRARQSSEDVSTMLDSCLAAFGLEDDSAPKFVPQQRTKAGRQVGGDVADGAVGEEKDSNSVKTDEKNRPKQLKKKVTAEVRTQPQNVVDDTFNMEREELGLINRRVRVEMIDDMFDDKTTCGKEGDNVSDELSVLSRYVGLLTTKAVDSRGIVDVPDSFEMVRNIRDFIQVLGISSLGEILSMDHTIVKTPIRDTPVWYVSKQGVLKRNTPKGVVCALLTVGSPNCEDEQDDIFIGLIRE